jgi:hypothetical protein
VIGELLWTPFIRRIIAGWIDHAKMRWNLSVEQPKPVIGDHACRSCSQITGQWPEMSNRSSNDHHGAVRVGYDKPGDGSEQPTLEEPLTTMSRDDQIRAPLFRRRDDLFGRVTNPNVYRRLHSSGARVSTELLEF